MEAQGTINTISEELIGLVVGLATVIARHVTPALLGWSLAHGSNLHLKVPDSVATVS